MKKNSSIFFALLLISFLFLHATPKTTSPREKASLKATSRQKILKPVTCSKVHGCKQEIHKGSESKAKTRWFWWLIIPTLGLIAYFLIGNGKEQVQRIEQNKAVNQDLNNCEAKAKSHSLIIDRQQKSPLVKQFLKKTYLMSGGYSIGIKVFYCTVRPIDIYQQGNSTYRITLSSDDNFGKSKMYGYFVLGTKGIDKIKFTKVYDDQVTSIQQGQYNNLFFQGKGDFDRLEGKWAYSGYERSGTRSGTWMMIDSR